MVPPCCFTMMSMAHRKPKARAFARVCGEERVEHLVLLRRCRAVIPYAYLDGVAEIGGWWRLRIGSSRKPLSPLALGHCIEAFGLVEEHNG